MPFHLNTSFISLLFLFLFTFTSSNINLLVNSEQSGKLPEDSYEFYTLELDSSLEAHKYNLVVRVFEDKGDYESREDFSDVDLYISVLNSQPKSPSTSTWFSERYGDDIITINKEHVEASKKFHIGVYCQFQCNYILKAYLSDIIDIEEGKVNSFLISAKSSITFKFHTKDDYDHLSFAFISPQMKPFKLYIAQNNPSSQNTYKLEPSWISGYTLDIKRGENKYCINCDYFIVAESQDQDVDISIIVAYPETELTLRPSEQIYDHVTAKGSKCYKYKISNFGTNNAIITNIVLFSGSVIAQVHGYDSNVEMTYSSIPYNDFTFEISTEKVIMIDKEDLEKMNSSPDSDEYYHFCIYGKERASYLVGTHLASESEVLQRLNYLLMGQSVMGYLPKGQVTKYRIFDLSRDANITLSLDVIEGNANLYVLMTDDLQKSYYTQNRLINELKEQNPKLLTSEETVIGYEKVIANKDNICHKKISSNKNLNDELKKMNCGLFAIVHCSPAKTNCIYRIRAKSDKSSQMLVPRTTLYNIISKDDVDYFSFNIEDDNVESASVVLNTISGETILHVYDNTNNQKGTKIQTSSYSYYLPNVVQLTPEKVKRSTLKGSYSVRVQSKSFSTYSIYYYTHLKSKNPSNTPQLNDIELQLEVGEIIEGYIYPSTPYKVYMFEKKSELASPRNYIITLTKKRSYLSLYVFKDLSKFNYDSKNENDKVSGYTWKADYDGEVIINKNEQNYSKNGPYYLVIVNENVQNNKSETLQTFYLSVTDEETPLLLYEGSQHGATLNDNYTHQTYMYFHLSTEYKFNLGINILYGRLNVYVDFEEITRERINNKANVLYKALYDENDNVFVSIPPTELKRKCKSQEKCPLYIYVEKNSKGTSQYLLVGKSENKRPFLLNAGIISENSMLIKDKHYYIIEENQAQQAGNVIVKFNDGDGDIYMNLVNEEGLVESSFPTETDYTYKGDDNYQGKLIVVPSLELQQCEPSCKYLITVIATSSSSIDTSVSYLISYSNDAKQMNQNVPIHEEIKAGQMHYYKFYFDETATSIYMSLYCSNGDADIYVNYGEELPTFNSYHWMSDNPQMDFITLDANDPFFVGKQQTTLKGFYTVLIYGYSSATYTLFATTHPKRIIPLGNNKPGTCKCKVEGEKCYFRFDDLVPEYEDAIQDISIVFSTNYLYGSGDQYVKLYKETDFDIHDHFPSELDHEWTNKNKNKRNFLKVDISKTHPNLTKNSMLLITVQCKEKSLLEMNSARIAKNSHQYLDNRRENLFYLEKSTQPTTLSFYYHEQKNIDFEFFTFTGKANVLVYQNTTSYNRTTNKYNVFYTHISSFQVDETKPYYNFLRSKPEYYNKNIYFKVTPKENIGFYVKLTYEEDWTRVDVGKTNSFQMNSGVFYGYFDYNEEYGDSVISIYTKDKGIKADIYVTVNIYERTSQQSQTVNPFNLRIPSSSLYDHKGTTDLFGGVSIKLSPIPADVFVNKHVRVLFKVVTTSTSKENKEIEKSIDVIVTPTVNNIKRIDTKPLRLYFSNAKSVETERTIFDLKKIRKTDDIFVIQLSSCSGKFAFALTNTITYFQEAMTSIAGVESKESNGKITITAHDLKETDYYLSVWGVDNEYDCDSKAVCEIKPKEDIEYLLYYYSTSKERYQKSKINELLVPIQTGKNEIEIKVGKLEQKDIYGNVQKVENINFKPFISTNVVDYTKMGSLCYLAKLERIPKGVKYHYDKQREVFVIKGLKNRETYGINLLIENPYTNELFVFTPAQLELKHVYGISGFMVSLIFIVVVGLSVALIYFYKKYKITKAILKYERNDLHSMGSLPEISSEMANVSADRVKYSTLTSD